MKLVNKEDKPSRQNIYFQNFEHKEFHLELEEAVGTIRHSLRSFYTFMQAAAKGLDELNGNSEASKEVYNGFEPAKESLAMLSIEVARVRCHLTGHDLLPDPLAEESNDPKADPKSFKSFMCTRCWWRFWLDSDERLVCLFDAPRPASHKAKGRRADE